MASLQARIDTFMNLAKENYSKSVGWQTFTECFDADDIEEFVQDLDSVFDVGYLMKDVASVWDDKHENARNERFLY
jgi:hypothetical protein